MGSELDGVETRERTVQVSEGGCGKLLCLPYPKNMPTGVLAAETMYTGGRLFILAVCIEAGDVEGEERREQQKEVLGRSEFG